MKKLILLPVFFICVVSCNKRTPEKDYKFVTEVVIDSCEYIVVDGLNERNIIHKANCNNNFHYKK